MRSESMRELAQVLPAQDGLKAARAEEEAEALTPPSRLHRTVRLLFLAIIAGCVAAVPAIVFHMRTHHYELHYISWVVAGICVMLTIPVSVFEIGNHLSHFYEPRLQRLVIRIMWMPVVFGIDNWMALRFKEAALYWTAATGAYEAWVIYSFYQYLEGVLERGHVPGTLAQLPHITTMVPHKHMLPCCCLPAWHMDDGAFVRRNKFGVLQYTVVEVCCTAITFATQFYDKLHEGEISSHYAYMYVTIAVNLSQITALYCLVLFYHAFNEELKSMRPLPKFLCVKLVVFFSFWQEMLLAALVHWEVIKYHESWTTYSVEDVAAGIASFLMCVEMLAAAIFHAWAFPYTDYVPPPGQPRPKFAANLKHMFSVADVWQDIVVVFGCVAGPIAPGFATQHALAKGGAPAAELAAAQAEAGQLGASEERRRRSSARKIAAAASAEEPPAVEVMEAPRIRVGDQIEAPSKGRGADCGPAFAAAIVQPFASCAEAHSGSEEDEAI